MKFVVKIYERFLYNISKFQTWIPIHEITLIKISNRCCYWKYKKTWNKAKTTKKPFWVCKFSNTLGMFLHYTPLLVINKYITHEIIDKSTIGEYLIFLFLFFHTLPHFTLPFLHLEFVFIFFSPFSSILFNYRQHLIPTFISNSTFSFNIYERHFIYFALITRSSYS